jgi:hypothetical protein
MNNTLVLFTLTCIHSCVTLGLLLSVKRRYKCNSILFMFIHDGIIKIYKCCHMIIHVISHVSYASSFIN